MGRPFRLVPVLAAALALAGCQFHPDVLLFEGAGTAGNVIDSSAPRPVTVYCEDGNGARYMAHDRCQRGHREVSYSDYRR
jgi:hypothetical protein